MAKMALFLQVFSKFQSWMHSHPLYYFLPFADYETLLTFSLCGLTTSYPPRIMPCPPAVRFLFVAPRENLDFYGGPYDSQLINVHLHLV